MASTLRNEIILESLKLNLNKRIRRINDLNRSIKMKKEHGHEQYLIPIHEREIDELREVMAELESLIAEYEGGE